MKQVVSTTGAPAAIGPYSQGIRVNDMIFVSGQLPVNPRTNQLIQGPIAAQTEQVLLNIREILEEGGARLDDVVRFFVIAKAAYEVGYEAANRPTWLPIPIAGLATELSRHGSNL